MDRIARSLDLRYFVVGATARDILMYHLHGFPVNRASPDIDFAMAIKSWEAFNVVKESLLNERGFRPELSPAKCMTKLGPSISRPFRAISLTRARSNSGHPKQLSSRCNRRPERCFKSRPYGLAEGPARKDRLARLHPPPGVRRRRVHASRSPCRGRPDGRAPRDTCHGHGAVDAGLEGGL